MMSNQGCATPCEKWFMLEKELLADRNRREKARAEVAKLKRQLAAAMARIAELEKND